MTPLMTIKSHHGKYLTAKENGSVHAKTADHSGWETFQPFFYEEKGEPKVALKTFHDKYLTAEKNGSVHAKAADHSGWQTWTPMQYQGSGDDAKARLWLYVRDETGDDVKVRWGNTVVDRGKIVNDKTGDAVEKSKDIHVQPHFEDKDPCLLGSRNGKGPQAMGFDKDYNVGWNDVGSDVIEVMQDFTIEQNGLTDIVTVGMRCTGHPGSKYNPFTFWKPGAWADWDAKAALELNVQGHLANDERGHVPEGNYSGCADNPYKTAQKLIEEKGRTWNAQRNPSRYNYNVASLAGHSHCHASLYWNGVTDHEFCTDSNRPLNRYYLVLTKKDDHARRDQLNKRARSIR